MSTDITDTTQTDALVKISGENALSVQSYEKNFDSDGSSELVEEYAGAKDKLEAFYLEAKGKKNLANGRLSISKATGRLTLTYQSDNGEQEKTTEDSEDAEDPNQTPAEWNLDVIEIQRPLASHPYFQTSYIPESGYEISELLAYVELLIAKGLPFSSPPQTAAYDEYLKRYYGLKCAGVESYNAVGLELSKVFITSDAAVCRNSYTGINQVENVVLINPPDLIWECMKSVEQIDGYTSSDPATVRYTKGTWEWLKKAPQLQSCGNENCNTVRISMSWWGIDRWSTVLYKGGTWDPGSNI